MCHSDIERVIVQPSFAPSPRPRISNKMGFPSTAIQAIPAIGELFRFYVMLNPKSVPVYTMSLVMTSTSYRTLGFSRLENISRSSLSYCRRSSLGRRAGVTLILDPLIGVSGGQRTVSAPIVCRNKSTSDATGVGSRPEFGILARADVGVLRAKNPDGSTVLCCKQTVPSVGGLTTLKIDHGTQNVHRVLLKLQAGGSVQERYIYLPLSLIVSTSLGVAAAISDALSRRRFSR